MKKKLLLLLLCFSLLFVSGCEVEVKYTINNDLSIEEDAIFHEDYSKVDTSLFTSGELFDVNVSNYKYILDNGFKYRADKNNKKDYQLITYKKYDNCSALFSENKDIFNNMFEKIDCSYNNGIYTIESSGEYYGGYSQVKLIPDKTVISIVLPFEVLESNADVINDNVHKWDTSASTFKKKIKLKFNSNNIVSEVNRNGSSTNNNSLNSGIIIGFLIVILGIGGVVYFVRLTGIENNKI